MAPESIKNSNWDSELCKLIIHRKDFPEPNSQISTDTDYKIQNLQLRHCYMALNRLIASKNLGRIYKKSQIRGKFRTYFPTFKFSFRRATERNNKMICHCSIFCINMHENDKQHSRIQGPLKQSRHLQWEEGHDLNKLELPYKCLHKRANSYQMKLLQVSRKY